MSFIVQCDRCQFNNSQDPNIGLHTMFDVRVNQINESPVVYEKQLCDQCTNDLVAWVTDTIHR